MSAACPHCGAVADVDLTIRRGAGASADEEPIDLWWCLPCLRMKVHRARGDHDNCVFPFPVTS